MKASEVIREMRGLLFERGWHQGAAQGPNGELCLLHASVIASNGQPRGRVRACLCEAIGYDFPSVWQDAPERTFSEVADALDRAEKIAEQRESDV